MDNPTPRDYEGGGKDFSVIRILDGHLNHPDPKKGRNPYKADEDSMGGFDEPIEPGDFEM